MLLFHLILLGFIKRLGILGKSKHGCLIPGFVSAMIFHHSLDLNFMYGGISRSTSSKDLLISLLYIKTRL